MGNKAVEADVKLAWDEAYRGQVTGVEVCGRPGGNPFRYGAFAGLFLRENAM